MADTASKDEELLHKVVRMIESKELRLRNTLIETARNILDIATNLQDGSMHPQVASDALVDVARKIVDVINPEPRQASNPNDE